MEPAGAAAETIELYYDYVSPYAYFAHAGITALAARHGLALRRRPMLLWAVLQAQNIEPPLQRPAKRLYLRHDMVRSAAFYGLPFGFPPGFPMSSHAAARLHYAVEASAPQLIAGYAQAVFEACFVQLQDISSLEVLAEIAGGLGLERQWARQAAASEAAREALRQGNEAAAQREVWGSPYWFHRGEAWFGADRLEQFSRGLQQAPEQA
jgi:2-hydroxychromene-2-carboxylate isomerase